MSTYAKAEQQSFDNFRLENKVFERCCRRVFRKCVRRAYRLALEGAVAERKRQRRAAQDELGGGGGDGSDSDSDSELEGNSDEEEDELEPYYVRKQLKKFYRKYSKIKLDNIDIDMEEYKGRYHLLYRRLKTKFGHSPREFEVRKADYVLGQLKQYYRKYDPQSESARDPAKVLESYEGNYAALYRMLLKKYGHSPAEFGVKGTVRRRLKAFFAKADPNMAPKIPQYIVGFEGRWRDLYAQLRRDYASQPARVLRLLREGGGEGDFEDISAAEEEEKRDSGDEESKKDDEHAEDNGKGKKRKKRSSGSDSDSDSDDDKDESGDMAGLMGGFDANEGNDYLKDDEPPLPNAEYDLRSDDLARAQLLRLMHPALILMIKEDRERHAEERRAEALERDEARKKGVTPHDQWSERAERLKIVMPVAARSVKLRKAPSTMSGGHGKSAGKQPASSILRGSQVFTSSFQMALGTGVSFFYARDNADKENSIRDMIEAGYVPVKGSMTSDRQEADMRKLKQRIKKDKVHTLIF